MDTIVIYNHGGIVYIKITCILCHLNYDIYTYIYICIQVDRESERERERYECDHVHVHAQGMEEQSAVQQGQMSQGTASLKNP
jgi:hypothetical protein